MMTIGHLTDIEDLHRAATGQNALETELAMTRGDETALRRARESAAFLAIVAGWITDSGGNPGKPE